MNLKNVDWMKWLGVAFVGILAVSDELGKQTRDKEHKAMRQENEEMKKRLDNLEKNQGTR